MPSIAIVCSIIRDIKEVIREKKCRHVYLKEKSAYPCFIA